MTPDTAEFPNNITWPVREWEENEDSVIESVCLRLLNSLLTANHC